MPGGGDALPGLQNHFTAGLISEAPSGGKYAVGLNNNILLIYVDCEEQVINESGYKGVQPPSYR